MANKKLPWHEYALGRLATCMVGISYDASQSKEKLMLAYTDMLLTCEMPVAEAHRLADLIAWMPMTLDCFRRTKLSEAVQNLVDDLRARKNDNVVHEEPERIMPSIVT